MTCEEHRWFAIRSTLWFKVLCLRCDERRRVGLRWPWHQPTNGDVMRAAKARQVI